MKGEKPTTVFAVTQQIKPELYPKVDDEATIVLSYPKAQAIIQASWNWPYSRKDIAIYGKKGHVKADRRNLIQIREEESLPEEIIEIAPLSAPNDDPFAYFANVINGKIDPVSSLSSLEVNMVVMEILEAAKTSAKLGKAIILE